MNEILREQQENRLKQHTEVMEALQIERGKRLQMEEQV